MWHGQYTYSVCLKKSAVIITIMLYTVLFQLPATEWINDFLKIW